KSRQHGNEMRFIMDIRAGCGPYFLILAGFDLCLRDSPWGGTDHLSYNSTYCFAEAAIIRIMMPMMKKIFVQIKVIFFSKHPSFSVILWLYFIRKYTTVK